MYLIFSVMCATTVFALGHLYTDDSFEQYHKNRLGFRLPSMKLTPRDSDLRFSNGHSVMGHMWSNKYKLVGNIICCCKFKQTFKTTNSYMVSIVENIEAINCTEKYYYDSCHCFLSQYNYTNKIVNDFAACPSQSQNNYLYIGIAVLVFIVALLVITVLLLRMKTGKLGQIMEFSKMTNKVRDFKIDKFYKGRQSRNSKSVTIIRRSFNANSNDRSGDTITRIKYGSLSNRENSHIYHSLDNLHVATKELDINRRMPFPLPCENMPPAYMPRYDVPSKKTLPVLLKNNFRPPTPTPKDPSISDTSLLTTQAVQLFNKKGINENEPLSRRKLPQPLMAPPPPLKPNKLAHAPASHDNTNDDDGTYEKFVNVSIYNF